MAIVELVMPKMGESIMEATILRWHKKPGDQVKADETVLEIATDKVDSEVPSIADGEITELLFAENEVVPVGAVIARIKTADAAGTPAPAPAQPAPREEVHHAPAQQEASYAAATPVQEQIEPKFTTGTPRFYSPLVLTIAQQEGVSFAELEKIPGSGNEGRVTKKDILEYVAARKQGTPSPVTEETVPVQAPVVASRPVIAAAPAPQYNGSSNGNVEIIEMDRMRKLIAEHMVRSKHTSPHVTSFAEADVTHMVKWRDAVKKDFERRGRREAHFYATIYRSSGEMPETFPPGELLPGW